MANYVNLKMLRSEQFEPVRNFAVPTPKPLRNKNLVILVLADHLLMKTITTFRTPLSISSLITQTI